MKKKWSQSDILNQYIKSGILMYKAALEGDYKTGNKEQKIVIKLFKYLENNIELAKRTLPILFDNENAATRTNAAAHCLALKVCVDKSEKVLEEVSKDSTVGIMRLTAEMTLKVWHEQGYLEMYQKNKID